MFKFLAKFGLKRSEEEIKNFLSLFGSGDLEENGMVVARAALIHYRSSSLDPEFSKLVNSQVGENQGPISTYILQLNKLLKEFHGSGEYQNAAGMKLWNITFRCMSNNSFRHYGTTIWENAAESFESAKQYLENELEKASSTGNEKMADYVKGALALYDFIPPQFRNI